MFKILNLYKYLNKTEKLFFLIIFIGIFLTTALEMVSFSAIVPLFKVLFSNEEINIPYLSNLDTITILFLFLLLFSFKNIILILFHYFYIKFFFKFCSKTSKRFFKESISKGYIFFKKNSSEYLIRKVTHDINSMRIYIISCLILMTEILFVLSLSILLIFFDYKIFLFGFIFFSITFFIYFTIFKKKIKNWSNDFQKGTGNVQFISNETVRGIKDIIIYNLQNLFNKKFSKYTDDVFFSQFKIEYLNYIQRFWMELLTVIIFTTSIIFLITSGLEIVEYLPIFALYAVGVFRLVPSLNKIILNKQNYKFYFPGFKSVLDQLSKLNNIEEKINKLNFEFEDNIEFKNVSFKFDDNTDDLFKNLSFIIKKNSTVLIKGKNGSGKSTLINLLSGLLNPTSGEVIIDKKYDLNNYKYNWIKKIGFVQQNIFILSSTIIDNIVLDNENIDHKKLNHIFDLLDLKKSFENFDKVIKDKNVGMDGINLSGGQKQIISIARALYKNPDLLIFDEAETSLDSFKIDNLTKLLKNLRGKKTVIIISHYLSGHENLFDEVLEIDKGKIIKI